MSGQAAFTITHSDLLAAYRLHHCGVRRRALVILIVYLAVLGVVMAWLRGPVTLAAIVGNAAFLFAVTGVVVVLLKVLLGRIWLPRYARRILIQQKSLHGEQMARWDDNALTSSSAVGEARLGWADFHAFAHSRDTLLLFHSEAMFQMIPTRAFANMDDRWDLLATIMRAGVPARHGRVLCRLQEEPVQS